MDIENHDSGSQLAVDGIGPPDRVRALSDPRRISILIALSEHGGSLSVPKLARNVSASERGMSVGNISHREERPVLTSLRHTHLPALASRSLIEWQPGSDTVILSAEDSAPQLSENLRHAEPSSSVRHLRTLSHPRRRLIVDVLSRRDGSISVEELGHSIAARERGISGTSPSNTAIDRVRISLVHSHLPALSAAGLIAYDEKDGIVSTVELPSE